MTRRLQILLVLPLLVLLADQGTKFWAVAELTRVFELEQARTVGEKLAVYLTAEDLVRIRRPPVAVLREHWHFKYVENPGAAWGLLGGLPDWLRLPFFHVVFFVAIGAILGLYRRLPERARLLQVALALVLGGALGNYVDRALRGYVVDFVDWHWKNQPHLHWPTFNVADVALCVGVSLLIARSLFGRDPLGERTGGKGEQAAGNPPLGGERCERGIPIA